MNNHVDSKKTWELVEENKDDIDVMKQCCMAELRTMEDTGLVPTPYYFERVAILSKKDKNYAQEVYYCGQYVEKIEAYYSKYGIDRVADIRKGPRYKAIVKRLEKARELLAKHKSK
ncbi:MAG: hypothetical protein RIB78_03275 [Gammaproteobacteria bacterium]|uniref:hypothetical protein n=1 Tax=Fulvivirga sp. TaxID=1931237 RepID=UPI0032EACD86